MPILLLPVTALLESNRRRLGPLERLLREGARWSKALDVPILPPAAYRRRDFSIAGAAFDYWLRAFLTLEFGPEAEDTTVLSQWAQNSANDRYFRQQFFDFPDGSKRSLRLVLDDVVNGRRAAIRGGDIYTDSFLDNCIDHGQLEGLYRSNQMRDLSCAQSTMVDDLRKLAHAVKERRELFAGRRVDLNPRFPTSVFAADGDVAIDDRLLEIKTTQDLIQPLAFLQALCYVVIEAWERGLVLSALRYREIGVFSARHAALGIVDLNRVEPALVGAEAFLREMADRHGGKNVRADEAEAILKGILKPDASPASAG